MEMKIKNPNRGKSRKGIILVTMVAFFSYYLTPIATVSISANNAQTPFSSTEIVGMRSAYEKNYLNADGTITAVINSNPIHFYQDEKWNDIDNTLRLVSGSNSNLYYQNTQNSMKVKFAEELRAEQDLVVIEYDNSKISWQPIIQNNSSVNAKAEILEMDDIKAKSESANHMALDARDKLTSKLIYNDVYEFVDFEFTVCSDSVKENIILHQPSELPKLQYLITAEDMSVKILDNNGICFLNKSQESVFTIPPMYMFDSGDATSYCYDIKYELNDTESGYLLTIIPDGEWLFDENRVYPITIDPTITISKSNISDTTIYSGLPNNNYGSTGYLVVGDHGTTYGEGKALLSFPITSLPAVESITSATLNIREGSGKTNSTPILGYCLGWGWSESTATWNNVNRSTQNGFCFSYSVINNAWNYIDITQAVQWWYNHSHTQANTGILNLGLVISSQSPTLSSKHFCSSENASYAPSISITYNTNMYSLNYVPYKYNHHMCSNSNFLYRMNCYGYAMQMYYRGSDTYKQQPGEFYAYRGTYGALEQQYANFLFSSNSEYMAFIQSKMNLDFGTLGYNITETTATASIPSGQRKIALVISPTCYGYDSNGEIVYYRDYHFYARNGDGTWSHKAGSTVVTNLSISTRVVLNDSNIIARAQEDIYTGGIKFFLISKDANVYEYAHANGRASSGGTIVY